MEDHAIRKIPKHYLAIPKCVKQDAISNLLKKLYTANFMENQTLPSNGINENLNKVSTEDIKFLKLMDEGCTRSDGLYQLQLPFWNSEVDLPNNRWLAERRLQCLKKKLQKDEKFLTDYIAFMDNLFNKGHASELAGIQPSIYWYIPHHGVYHPHKPDKIRVVFDCSSEFQGRSLNKEPLCGHDPTNQIVGILSRFRENEIALMAHIESIFYQVQVSEEHRRFLKFLW